MRTVYASIVTVTFAMLFAACSDIAPPACVQIVSASPTALTFAPTAPGSTDVLELMVRNHDQRPARLDSLRFDAPEGVFSLQPPDSLPLELAPNEQVHLEITYTPTSLEAVRGELVLLQEGSGGACETRVDLLAEADTAELRVEPNGHDFGGVSAGQSAEVGFVVTNASAVAPLVVQDIFALADGDAMHVLPEWPEPTTLAPGEHAEVTVRFSPPAAAFYQGELIVKSSASEDPGAIALSGTGVE